MTKLEKKILFTKIEQLHNVTLNFSKASIQMKQIMFTLIAIVAPIIIKLSGDHLDISLFITLYLIIFVFHFLDSFTYYYQKKMRAIMDSYFDKFEKSKKERSLISNTKNEKCFIHTILKSVFNYSTLVYVCLFFLNTIGLVLFHFGIIA